MSDKISPDEIKDTENTLPESYRNLIEYNVFKELTDGKKEDGDKEKCR